MFSHPEQGRRWKRVGLGCCQKGDEICELYLRPRCGNRTETRGAQPTPGHTCWPAEGHEDILPPPVSECLFSRIPFLKQREMLALYLKGEIYALRDSKTATEIRPSSAVVLEKIRHIPEGSRRSESHFPKQSVQVCKDP